MDIYDNFETRIDPRWHVREIGTGAAVLRYHALHLTLPQANSASYSDAQITDYDPAQRQFQYRPPLRMTVTAYSSAPAQEMQGTMGFGFWNHPFVPGERGFRMPQALWFFFSAPPNDMTLVRDVPGHGWKCATLNAKRSAFYALLPAAPLAIPLMNIPPLYRALWPLAQRAIGVSECLLDDHLLTAQHTYALAWLPDKVSFFVDDALVHETTQAIPQRPLGFIAWIDNQYAIVSPKGRFGFGLIDVPHSQSLVLQDVKIESLAGA